MGQQISRSTFLAVLSTFFFIYPLLDSYSTCEFPSLFKKMDFSLIDGICMRLLYDRPYMQD